MILENKQPVLGHKKVLLPICLFKENGIYSPWVLLWKNDVSRGVRPEDRKDSEEQKKKQNNKQPKDFGCNLNVLRVIKGTASWCCWLVLFLLHLPPYYYYFASSIAVELTLANDHATNSLSALISVGNKMEFVPTLLAMLSKHTSFGHMYRTLHLMAAVLHVYWMRAIKNNIIGQ